MIKREEPQCASRSRNKQAISSNGGCFLNSGLFAAIVVTGALRAAVNGGRAHIADGGRRRRGGIVVVSAAYTVAQ